jgi:hypothetical protein
MHHQISSRTGLRGERHTAAFGLLLAERASELMEARTRGGRLT